MTVKNKVLAALLNGEKLTPYAAWQRFGTSRLASVIHELRGEGHPIDTHMVEVGCADGRVARVAEYWFGPY